MVTSNPPPPYSGNGVSDAAQALAAALSDLGACGIGAISPTNLPLAELLKTASIVIQGLTHQVGNTKAQRDMLSSVNSAWFWFWDIAHNKLRIESGTAPRGPRRHLDTSSWQMLLGTEQHDAVQAIEAWPSLPQESLCLSVRIKSAAGDWNSLVWQGRIVRRNALGNGIYAVGILHPADEAKRPLGSSDALSQMKLDFLANISHEIRTPMTAILGAACMAMESTDLHEQKDLARTIKLSTEALVALLSDTLEFAKVQAGRTRIEPETFDLLALTGETCRLFSLEAESKGVSLLIRSAPGFPRQIVADPGNIRQILVNLLSNAIKFTTNGEIEVGIQAIPSESDRTRGQLLLAVRDTGIGIPIDRQSSVFDMFTQADTSTKRKYGGTGLGLAICKRLAQLMGGSMSLKSSPGKGSTFALHIGIGFVPDDDDNTNVFHGEPIVVLEENPSQRDALCEMLRELGGLPYSDIRCADLIHSPNSTNRIPVNPGALIVDVGDYSDEDLLQLAPLPEKLGIPAHRLILLRRHSDASRSAVDFIRFVGASIVSKPYCLRDLEAVLNTPDDGFRMTTDEAAPSQRRSLRILLAEDNGTNREVISSMLERAGHQVIPVANGQLAVDAFQREAFGFDIVILDVQMPIMDGFEAAEAIRGCEERRSWVLSENWRSTPILALTADALKGMEQKCIDAGMNGMLLKPSTPNAILATVERLVASASPSDTISMPFPIRSPMAPAQGDMADALFAICDRAANEAGSMVIDLNVALSWVGNDIEQLGKLLRSFIDELPGFIESTDLLIANGSHQEVGRLAHQIKSSLEIVGASALRQLASELQITCQQENNEVCRAVWRELKSQLLQLSCLLEEMSELFGSTQPAAAHATSLRP